MTQLPRQCRRIVLVVAAVGLVSIRAASSGGFATAAHFSKCAVSEGCRATSISYHRKSQSFLPLIVRGGASEVDEEDEYDEDTEDESEEEVDSEESEEEEEDTVLFASLTKASTKQKAKDKAKLSAVLKSIPKKKKRRRGGSVAFMKIPYLIRIMFQPLTLFAMTRGYWRSLFDPFYPEIDASENLRSALEAKARRGDPSGGGKRRRAGVKMKRGQAKTISDLPVLSA